MRTRVLPVLVGTLGAALLTAFAFLARAGDPGANNWPVFWELRSSDNGVLFQVVQDVFAGRVLDWSFSPQVYVFPELPISALGYLIAGGDVYRYYLVVAVLANALLFLALLPQFVDPGDSWSLAAQITALGLVHVLSCAIVYTLVAVGARVILGTRPGAARIVSRVSGTAMSAIGVFLLVERLLS